VAKQPRTEGEMPKFCAVILDHLETLNPEQAASFIDEYVKLHFNHSAPLGNFTSYANLEGNKTVGVIAIVNNPPLDPTLGFRMGKMALFCRISQNAIFRFEEQKEDGEWLTKKEFKKYRGHPELTLVKSPGLKSKFIYSCLQITVMHPLEAVAVISKKKLNIVPYEVDKSYIDRIPTLGTYFPKVELVVSAPQTFTPVESAWIDTFSPEFPDRFVRLKKFIADDGFTVHQEGPATVCFKLVDGNGVSKRLWSRSIFFSN